MNLVSSFRVTGLEREENRKTLIVFLYNPSPSNTPEKPLILLSIFKSCVTTFFLLPNGATVDLPKVSVTKS